MARPIRRSFRCARRRSVFDPLQDLSQVLPGFRARIEQRAQARQDTALGGVVARLEARAVEQHPTAGAVLLWNLSDGREQFRLRAGDLALNVEVDGLDVELVEAPELRRTR